MSKLQALKNLFSGTELEKELDLEEILSRVEGNDSTMVSDTFIGAVEDDILAVDFIYYLDAMDYLAKHDESLQDSLELAYHMGYTLQDVNSTILATLYKQNLLREELYNKTEGIEEIFANKEKEEIEIGKIKIKKMKLKKMI